MTPPAVELADTIESSEVKEHVNEPEVDDVEMADATAQSAQAPSPPAEPVAKASPPTEHATIESTGEPVEQPVEKLNTGSPSSKRIQQGVEHSPQQQQQPAEQTPELPIAQPVEQTAEQSTEKSVEQPTTERAEEPAEKCSVEAPRNPVDEKPAEKSAECGADNSPQEPEQRTELGAALEMSSTTMQSPNFAENTDEPVEMQLDDDNAVMTEGPADGSETNRKQGQSAEANTGGDGPTISASATQSLNNEPLENASVPLTVDTSMTDAPALPSAKIARGREEEVDDEPLAKRVRTSGEDGDQGSATPVQSASTDGKDKTEVGPVSSPAPGAAVPLSVNGKPLKLNDPALANNPITPHQSKEIKKVLALVKKTKSGQMFRSPVQILWPGVWEQYRLLIKRPVDISFIEQNLRDNKYTTMSNFRSDVQLIIDNATKFNGADHDVTKAAKAAVAGIYTRLADVSAEEPVKATKQDMKYMPVRSLEPRQQQPPPPKKDSRPVGSSSAEKVSDAPVFAVPPSGVPTIRRDSTKNAGDRPKRPIHPPKNKDLGFQPKNMKNKRKPEMKFCEEVLKELKQAKHWVMNQYFLEPVDPVALNIPTYHSVIKQPMDLGTMMAKLDSGEYESANAFKADFQLMIKNCTKFNPEGHLVHTAGKELEKLFERKWSEKATWMSKHAQTSTPAVTSPHGATRDEEDEEDETEAEQENSVDVQEVQRRLDSATAKLKRENDELNKQLFSDNPDSDAIDILRTVIQAVQNRIIKLRAEVNTAREKKSSQVSKPSKKKTAGSSSSGAKKAANNAAPAKKGGGSSAKKSAKKKLTEAEKEVVSDTISRLDGGSLTKAIEIIKKDTNLTETDDDELELDMEQLSEEALVKLFDLIVKAFPEKKSAPAPAPAAAPASQSATAVAKKKNKPMGKAEQERKLEQLKALKDSYSCPGSGSQEPVPSIEPNETADVKNKSSDDASSSEEE